MSTPTLPTTLTPAEREAFTRLSQRGIDWRPQKAANIGVAGCTTGKVAWYHGGPDGQLHAVAIWAPSPDTGRIEALCGATSWGWSETDPGTLRGRCSECATRAHGMPLLNPAKP